MALVPEFDTYGCLPRFARNPDDPMLRRMLDITVFRASRKLRWEAIQACLRAGGKFDLMEAFMAERAGFSALPGKAGNTSGSDGFAAFGGKTAEQLKDSYDRMLELYKKKIDPGDIIDENS